MMATTRSVDLEGAMYTDAASLRRPVVRSPLLLLGVKSGLYVDACLPGVWVVVLSCLASVEKRSCGS